MPLGQLLVDSRGGYWGLDPGASDVDARIVRNGDVKPESGILWDQLPVRSLTQSEIQKAEISRGDLLLTTSGDCGVVAMVTRDVTEPIAASNFVRILRANRSLVEPRYLYWYMRTPRFRGALNPFIRGTTMKNLSLRAALTAVMVPVPALSEQRRIAVILDRADALRGKRRASLEMLENLQRSLFVSKFGTPESFHERWAELEIRDVAIVSTGKTPPSGDSSMFNGLIPFVTPGDLDSGMPPVRSLSEVGALHSRTVEAGATFVCCIGATIGKVGRATERAAFNQQINAIEWGEDVNPVFGYFLMWALAPKVRAAGTSTTLPLLKKSLFERLRIPVPPRDLQDEFAAEVDMTRSWQERLANSDLALNELYASLQFRAFRERL